MPESVLGPSYSGSVVLEIGPGMGAIVLYTPPGLDGAEIEISMSGAAPGRRAGGAQGQHRTHSQVRERRTNADVRYAAVYPNVPEGDYTIWRDAETPAMHVRVTGGTVTTAWWPDSTPVA